MHTTSEQPQGGKQRIATNSDHIEATGGSAYTTPKALSFKSISLFVAPSVLFLALAASSTYTLLQLSESLSSLNARVGQLLEAQTVGRTLVEGAVVNRPPEEAAAQTAAHGEKADTQGEYLQQIEKTLSVLTESISHLNSQFAAASAAAAPRAPAVLPPLPALPSPSLGPAHKEHMQANVLAAQSDVANESRMAANEILRDYAELARTEIQALNKAGKLDEEAMVRIKRDTRLQAANELRSQLPPDAFEAMFPTEVDH